MDVYYKPDGGVKITCIYDNVADSGSQFCITWLRPEQAVELGVQLIKTAAILPGELAKIHESRAEKARRRQLARNEKNNTRQSPRA
ncbi:MAG TPA: hypothetical protein DDZ51_30100 [Planctomycetaceae bacterium]|nr:hypothetical protein [Planctomycetaceae bacterium]